jgi:hypothetical protein
MTRQKTNHTSTQETQSDENQAIRAWSRQSISPIDLETLSPQNRARLNTAVMTLVDYLVSVSPRT